MSGVPSSLRAAVALSGRPVHLQVADRLKIASCHPQGPARPGTRTGRRRARLGTGKTTVGLGMGRENGAMRSATWSVSAVSGRKT